MTWIHHNKLRVNGLLPDDLPSEAMDIYREHGWTKGLHPDTDPNDRWVDVPRVLPESEPEPAKPKTRKGTN